MASAMRWKAAGFVLREMKSYREPGAPSFGKRLAALPRLVSGVLQGTYSGASMGKVSLWIIALAYVVSPIDLLPELFLPLLGSTDDAFVIAWLAASLSGEASRFIEWERTRDNTIHSEVVH